MVYSCQNIMYHVLTMELILNTYLTCKLSIIRKIKHIVC
jgi:hypothetical protein